MNKNKKLVAFICALSMIFSLMSAFTVVRAAGESIELVYNKDKSTATTKVIDVKAVGVKSIGSYTLHIKATDGVATDAKQTYTLIASTNESFENDTYKFTTYSQEATEPTVPANGIIHSVAFTVKNNEEFTVSLTGKTGIAGTGYDVDMETLSASTLTVPVWVDPTAPTASPTPTPVPTSPARPSAAPKATEDPSATGAPTVKPTASPVAVSKGLQLEYDAAKSSDSKAVINVKAVGVESIGSYTLHIAAPEGKATDAKQAYTLIASTNESFENNTYKFTTYSQEATEPTVPANGIIHTVEFILADGANDEPFEVTLTGKTGVAGTGYDLDLESMPAALVTVPAKTVEPAEPTAAPTAVPSKPVALKDEVASDAETKLKDAEGDNKITYVTVQLNDASGNPVVDTTKFDTVKNNFGTTFDATYDNEPITAEELFNILNGYDTTRKPSDAIKKLKFNIYNTSPIKSVSTTTNAETAAGTGTFEQITEPVNNKTIGDAVTPQAPAISASNVTAYVDKNFDVKVSVSNFADKTNPKVAFEIVKNSNGDAFDNNKNTSVIQVYGRGVDQVAPAAAQAAAATVTQKFTANAKGTAYIKVTYTDDENNTVSKVVTVTVKEEKGGSDDSDSSKSKSSGGGAIASGAVNGTVSGNIPLGFTDMDDADWARDAVNALALRNVVSGVGDSKFDPNGALTRAAYAQMLINAIGKQSDYADTYFNDVPTDSWFYHNVAVAAQLGIVSGYGDGNFGPYDLITREQMALMTQKAAVVMQKSLAGASVGTFTDDADIADWSKDAVYTLANAGIINGMGDGTFAPKANATRAQAAVIIYNAFVK